MSTTRLWLFNLEILSKDYVPRVSPLLLVDQYQIVSVVLEIVLVFIMTDALKFIDRQANDNYTAWKTRIKALLDNKELWQFTDPTKDEYEQVDSKKIRTNVGFNDFGTCRRPNDTHGKVRVGM